MIALTLLMNQLVIIHSVHHYTRPVIGSKGLAAYKLADSSPTVEPFVSVVLLETINSSPSDFTTTVSSLQETTSSVLAKEIVLPESLLSSTNHTGRVKLTTSLSDSSDFIIFVVPGISFPADWLNGMVREFLANETRLVVPLVKYRGQAYGGAMIGSSTGVISRMAFEDGPSRQVPVIPELAVVGVSRHVLSAIPNFESLATQKRVIEISLRAWLCFGGIIFTRFTTVSSIESELPDWKSVEGEDVDERITNCPRTIDWFYRTFEDFDPEAAKDQFRIRNGDRCLESTGSKIWAAPCTEASHSQVFELGYEGKSIRSVAHKKCLDAGSANEAGTAPLLYHCFARNRNQMFSLVHGRLMWGSFCVDADNVTFQYCIGIDESTNESQQWVQEPVSS